MTQTTTDPRPEKVAAVEEISTRLQSAQATLFAEYRGLTVAELAELRGTLRELGAIYKVYKNTLARLAAKDANAEEIDQYLVGPTAIVFVNQDSVTTAKALSEFAKTHEALILKGGIMGPRVLTADDLVAL